jgi:hypothetical protein
MNIELLKEVKILFYNSLNNKLFNGNGRNTSWNCY